MACLHAAVVTLGSLKRCSSTDYWSVPIWKLALFLILYSIPLCWVHYGLAEKTSVQIIYVDCQECYDGRKIVYDLSNLVYNDNIPNRCIQMLLLYTFVWYSGFCFEPEVLTKCNTGCASYLAAVNMECMSIKQPYIFIQWYTLLCFHLANIASFLCPENSYGPTSVTCGGVNRNPFNSSMI